MGAKGSKGKVPPKSAKLTSKDIKHLSGQTGLSKDEISKIFDQFNANNPDGRLDRNEFVTLYSRLRPEPADRLDEISHFVFSAFDTDGNGELSGSIFNISN